MNGRDDARTINKHDQALLAQIAISLSDEHVVEDETTSLGEFSSHLAHVVPQANEPFRQQLEERLIAENIHRRQRMQSGLLPGMSLYSRRPWRSLMRLLITVISIASIFAILLTAVIQLKPASSNIAAQPTQLAKPVTSANLPTISASVPTAPPHPTAVPVPLLPPITPLRVPYLEVGVVSHLYYTDRERVLTLTNTAGFEWVRQQVVWKDIEGPEPGHYVFDEVDNIVNDVATHNLKLLVNIVQAPSFYTANGDNGLPEDPKPLGDFVEAMAKHYGDKIAAYEIWNEQNLGRENGGHVTTADAGKYVELLAECYKRIKAVTPNAFVLAGGASSTGVNDPSSAVADMDYYRAMYQYKDGMIKNFFDAQAVHPGGSANPPDTLWPDKPSKAEGWTDNPTFYFRHVENVRQLMIDMGLGDRQIWITEFGWVTKNSTPGYEFGNQVSFDQQANYIIGAIDRTYTTYRDNENRPWVGIMFLWNMNFSVLRGAEGQSDHEQAAFSILNPDWTPRPAFTALQGYLPKLKQREGR